MIPNEGHKDPNAKPKELRVVNQPYIPQNAVVNTGATVTWLNATAGHHHQVILVNNSSKEHSVSKWSIQQFSCFKINQSGLIIL